MQTMICYGLSSEQGNRGQGAGSILRTADFEVAVRQAEQGRGPAAGFCCCVVQNKCHGTIGFVGTDDSTQKPVFIVPWVSSSFGLVKLHHHEERLISSGATPLHIVALQCPAQAHEGRFSTAFGRKPRLPIPPMVFPPPRAVGPPLELGSPLKWSLSLYDLLPIEAHLVGPPS